MQAQVDVWETLPALVTAKVLPVLGRDKAARQPVVAYLRDLEAIARSESSSRAAIQVLVSGRRLLGDMGEVGTSDGPSSRT